MGQLKVQHHRSIWSVSVNTAPLSQQLFYVSLFKLWHFAQTFQLLEPHVWLALPVVLLAHTHAC